MRKKHVICYVNSKGFFMLKGEKYTFKRALFICTTRNIVETKGVYFPFPVSYGKLFFKELQEGKK